MCDEYINIGININNINKVVHKYPLVIPLEIVLSFRFLITLSQLKLMSYDCYLVRKSAYDFYCKSRK